MELDKGDKKDISLMMLTIYEQFLKISVESYTPKFISYIRVKCEKKIIENH